MTIIKTIGPDGDYKTIAEWLSDCPSDESITWKGVISA